MTFGEHSESATKDTFDLWDIWSEWWGDMTRLTKRQNRDIQRTVTLLGTFDTSYESDEKIWPEQNRWQWHLENTPKE